MTRRYVALTHGLETTSVPMPACFATSTVAPTRPLSKNASRTSAMPGGFTVTVVCAHWTRPASPSAQYSVHPSPRVARPWERAPFTFLVCLGEDNVDNVDNTAK